MAVSGTGSTVVIVFGRPGAGKTTICTTAFTKLQELKNVCLVIDLDVCIPNWMRENFAKGIYPTLNQRNEFALSACDYVDKEINKLGEKCIKDDNEKQPLILISFSFVNTDLRVVFRSRFPSAKWALVDVDDVTAQDRIEKREGHFYKGAPRTKEVVSKKSDASEEIDKSEWNFAPVDFEHVILDGLVSIDENVNIVIALLTETS